MIEYVESLFAKYRQSGILVDTNILLLYVVGLTNKQRIPIFPRTEKFISKDFELLNRILKSFQRIVTTQSVLTEVSNLANQLGEPERSKCMGIFAAEIKKLEEPYCASRELSDDPKFQKFGLTDCGISRLSYNRYLVLTDDFPLSQYLATQGIDAINFNNIRKLGWSS